ncbi:MAG TPA: hypothetical protein VEO54_09115 [Thermoanaerobaculia bacterium]|nr:hypothetical protein [Thermoanaerobaculia bacterium]
MTGKRWPGHAHDSLQLCVVLEGGFLEEFNGSGFECAPSTIPAAASSARGSC